MKIQINHYVPEENIVQQDIFEDVEKFKFNGSCRGTKQIFLDIEFKYGSENWKKFRFHCCGVEIDFNLDTVCVIED